MGSRLSPASWFALGIVVTAAIVGACSTPTPNPGPNPTTSPSVQPQPNPSPSSSTLAPCYEDCSCTIHLTWQAPASNSDPVAGYYIYWGTTPGGPYPNQIDAYNGTQLDVPNFCKGDYYFVAKSYDAQGNLSTDSNEAGVPVNTTTAATPAMAIHVGPRVPAPQPQAGQPCDPQDNLVNDVRQQTQPAYQAAQAVLDGGVHPTVRITGVYLTGGPLNDTPSSAALDFAKGACDGQRSCEIHPGDFSDPAPGVNWSVDVEWVCDHTPDQSENRISLQKNSQGSLFISCWSN